MAGVVAARAPWRGDRSPSHLSDSTRVSSDPPPAVHPTARDDDPPRDDVPPSSVLEVEDLLASLRVAPNQVAGHSSKGVGLPSLVDDSGHFLKPAPDDRKGVAELAFYERVWKGVERGDDDDDDDDEACSRKKDHADGRNGGKAGGLRTGPPPSPASPPSSPSSTASSSSTRPPSSPSRETTRPPQPLETPRPGGNARCSSGSKTSPRGFANRASST